MLFLDLEIINFRPYVRPNKIIFATEFPKNVTLIHGLNGAGKTSLLTALNWVLFGSAAVVEDGADPNPLVNKEVTKKGTKEQPARAVVHLRFSDGGRTYKLTRSTAAYRDGNHTISVGGKVELWVTLPSGNSEAVAEPDLEIRKMLPFAIRTFFLFDGDKVGDFTTPGKENNEKITRAVNDVLQIKPLRNGVAHLGQLKNSYLKKMQSIPAPKAQETKNLLTISQVEHKRVTERRVDLEEEVGAKRERLEIIDRKISSFVGIQSEAQERRRVEGQLAAAISAKVQLRRDLAVTVMRHLTYPIRDRIANSIALLTTYKSDHRIPAKIQDYFIRELLEQQECICGREIVPNSAADIRLRDILSSLLPGSLQDQASELLTYLKPMLKDIAGTEHDIAARLDAIQKNDLLIDRLTAKIEELGGVIDEKAVNEAKRSIEERKHLLHDVAALEQAIREAVIRLASIEKRQTEYQKALETAIATQDKVSLLAQTSALFRALHEELSSVERELEVVIREALGAESTEILRAFAGRDFFDRIAVDKDFVLSVFDSVGDDVRNQLSNGQKQITALAFMIGMTRLGGQDAPMVVDTPLARLDEKVRVNLMTKLPELKRQVIFLFQDTEYAGGVVEALAPSVGREFYLDYHDGQTFVEEAKL